MRIEVMKTYKELHTWTGIISGLFLYVCFLAGAFTMFAAPLNEWALKNTGTLPEIPLEKYDHLIQEVLAEHSQARKRLTIHLPDAMPQSAPATWVVENPDTHATTEWHASFDEYGELVTSTFTVSAVGTFIDQLHRTAGIPGSLGHEDFGTVFMGAIALLYFIAMVSGLIIFLPSWIKDLFSLRRGKNRKRFWLDAHNILGITALPFHLVIAFTTVVFAFHDVLYDSMGAWIYKDNPMFTRAAPQAESRELHELATVTQVIESIRVLEPEFQAAELMYMRMESPSPGLRVGGLVDGQLARGAEYTYTLNDPYSAEVTMSYMLPSQSGPMATTVISFFALHFGNFGGQFVRWLYFLLGVSGALLFLTGNILWIETRRKRQKKDEVAVVQNRSAQVMAQLTVGVCTGTPIGMLMTFLCVKWLPHQAYELEFWQQLAYYVGFFISLIIAFILRPFRAGQILLGAAAVLTILLLLSNVISGWGSGYDSLMLAFDLLAVMFLAVLAAVIYWMGKRARLISKDSVWACV
ncbi:hypothetical protein TDB9533_00188 [Thalassocella blandensis]|nr:hypothetical protein TDB9533_00188 [Thalassocella blandensis]